MVNLTKGESQGGKIKKSLIVFMVFSMAILSNCWFNDGNDENGISESELTDGIWYLNDLDVYLQITTNSNQTANNIYDEGIGEIILHKGKWNNVLKYFSEINNGGHYLRFNKTDLNYVDHSLSYHYGENEYFRYLYVDPWIIDIRDYYSEGESTSASWDSTNSKLTIPNDIILTNRENESDKVTLANCSITLQHVDVPAKTPTILDYGLSFKYDIDVDYMDFMENGNVIGNFGWDLDTIKWELKDDTLLIIDDRTEEIDTNKLHVSIGDGNLIFSIEKDYDTEDFEDYESDLNLDSGSMIAFAMMQKIYFSHTQTSNNIKLSKKIFDRKEKLLKRIKIEKTKFQF